jgi:RNA polymerase sigma factor (sigma-70 family)
MRGRSSPEIVRNLRTLYQFGVAGSLSDEQLLDQFLARRDEAAEEAFAELVQRHGSMVLGVCRRILGDKHEAEDAFQATFLVLARKAASVVRREKVASWLYGVAVRTAKEARVRAARRRAREERVSSPIHVDPPDDGFPDELRDILDEELARLPARHRGAVVLCELEGLSRPEAARRLGIPEGTLSSRLARAKAQLRDRLASRGVALPAAALSTILIREARAVTVPLSLLESTVQAATLVAAGPTATAAAAISASVASLSEGVIQTMLVSKLKGIVLVVGTMTAVVSGAVVLAQSGPGRPVPVLPASVETKAELPSLPPVATGVDQDDRTTALEKKLDRVLEALEHLSPTSLPSANSTVTSSVESDAAPTTVEPPANDAAPAPAQPGPQGSKRNGPMGPPTREATLVNRVNFLEKQMQQVQHQLQKLEKRLQSLDARVGGSEAGPPPPTPLEPLPPAVPDRRSN